MAEYKIYFKRCVVNGLNTISKRDLRRIINRIGLLKEEPRPPGCEKLSGQECYRVRQGNYRIVYSIQNNQLIIQVFQVRHRLDA